MKNNQRKRHLLSVATTILVIFVSEILSDDNFYRINRHEIIQKKLEKRQTTDMNSAAYKDNRKPQFLDCKNYSPELKEEQDPNEYVTKVEAVDPDENDRIMYSIVTAPNERARFKINPTNGEIRTAHTFDRDEPTREKEAYVTVRATDNGRPALDDVCTFKVTIIDVNDNDPVFDKSKYEESISEDLRIGGKVTRITASDLDDGENSVVIYDILPEKDYQYFHIENSTGVIKLKRGIDKKPGQYYTILIKAHNKPPHIERAHTITMRIRVIETNKKPPTFFDKDREPFIIPLFENYNDFEKPIHTLEATSNMDRPELIYELIRGVTEQTNKDGAFVYEQTNNTVIIKLGKLLDYEAITDYTLTMSVKNRNDLTAEYIVKVILKDVNDNIPYFTEVTTGTISENEPPGTQVMQVRAFDRDGTSPNNKVYYELLDHKDLFEINRDTGNITSLKVFDREEVESYDIQVMASDSAPSSLLKSGKSNSASQVFRIDIADKNDHPPRFRSDYYVADSLPEDANINALVIEVSAIDKDAASQISYSIVSGNTGEAFKIEESTGKITVNNKLDYETTVEYTLKIRAFDGAYDDQTSVSIRLENVNDNPPVFENAPYKTILQEEELVEGCIISVRAFDPDIKDRNMQQNIHYSILSNTVKGLLTIDNDGCITMENKLDRDEPNGHKNWQVIVAAKDDNGNGLAQHTDVSIELTDINDNAPFLTNKMPVVWNENLPTGKIVQLESKDYDEFETNGGDQTFNYQIAHDASDDIKQKFSVSGESLYALETFDREMQKEYFIPIEITDNGSPPQSNVSIMHLVIGDENDNPMEPGESSIFVYNYKGEAPDTEIGRVYVNDPDDWDLPDKTFQWKDGTQHENFELDKESGMIIMRRGTRGGSYILEFTVFEESRRIERHSVIASVNVTVKEIPEEAVDKSGSIRFHGITAEEFIDSTHNIKDRMRDTLAQLFNTSIENVDIFTVLKNDQDSALLDVRYSAHGSPYYEPEKMNGQVALKQMEIEQKLGLKMLMINIDECLLEKSKCETSCVNYLHKSNNPLKVYTNTTSFVGVNAKVEAECVCKLPESKVHCLNGGTRLANYCECPEGFDGPHCEILAIGFYGSGYAMYPPINPCNSTKISLEVIPQNTDGLIMYIGPMSYNARLPVQDFLSLELIQGYPILTVDYGTGSTRIEHKYIKFEAGKAHTIDIYLQKTGIEMTVDNCRLSTCMSLGAPPGSNEYLNVNSPIHIGGSSIDLNRLASKFNWNHTPGSKGYHGCIRNLTIEDITYNLGQPSLMKAADPGCHRSLAVAVSFGIDRNFLIAIIVCIVVLLILILAVVVHKKSYDGWHEKDMDDIRETIINYEDEGGGERDTDYDLNVLRGPPIYEDKPYKDYRQKEEVPDIGAFLTDKKDECDKDTDAYPVDDVRHYAYEGDGNSTGSLSSLASCTDEGDLKFNYLSDFGPRFRKLADMYGEDTDTDSNADDEGWRI